VDDALAVRGGERATDLAHDRRDAIAAPLVARADEPKPRPVDIKPFRDKLIVLADAAGGTYVVKPGEDAQVFYGTGKTLYAQVVVGRSANEDGWSVDVWAPRTAGYQPGSIIRRPGNGAFEKFCGGDTKTGLSLVTGDKARAILDKSQFVTTALMRTPHAFLRDDAGVYYYVDQLRKDYGGKGCRVFVGKKGAMKALPLTDVAIDSGGEVFATKTGDLRLVIGEDTKTAVWVKGGKTTKLTVLDMDRDEPIIFKELGIYSFIGTICDDS
jgi:hypothetical protein